jgi:hypothetical protein
MFDCGLDAYLRRSSRRKMKSFILRLLKLSARPLQTTPRKSSPNPAGSYFATHAEIALYLQLGQFAALRVADRSRGSASHRDFSDTCSATNHGPL